MTSVYKYFFQNPSAPISGNFLGELQGIYGVNMTRYLSKPGDMVFSMRGDSLINSPDANTLPASVILPMTTPFGSSIWVYRDDILVWAGLITSRTWQSESKVFNFTASTHDRYLQSVNCNVGDFIAFVPEYPANLIYQIVRRIQSSDSACIHNASWPHTFGFAFAPTEIVNDPAVGMSGPQYTLVASAEKAPEFWELMEYAMKLGAEYRVVPQTTGVTFPQRTVVFEKGQRDGTESHLVGKSSSQVTMTIQYPGSIYRYWWPESVGNHSGAADVIIMRGKDDGVSVFPKRDIYPFTPTVLRVSRRFDYDMTTQADLDNVPSSTFTKFYPPVLNPTFELDISHPDISPYTTNLDVGDYIKYIVQDPIRFGSTIQTGTKRVIGTVLSPPSEDSVEQFGVQLEEVI